MHHLAVFPKWESWTWTESEFKQEPLPHCALLAQMWTLCMSGATVNTVWDWILVSLTRVFTSPSSNSSGKRHVTQLHFFGVSTSSPPAKHPQASILLCSVYCRTTHACAHTTHSDAMPIWTLDVFFTVPLSFSGSLYLWRTKPACMNELIN